MTTHILTAGRLRELLHYEPNAGVFTWLVNSGKRTAGDIAGCTTSRGYRQIKVDGHLCMAHRLAWLYVYGVWPQMLDHKDGNRLNNAIGNLRECTGTLNNANIAKHARNKSGFKGVYKNGPYSTWVARIGLSGTKNREFLGCYANAREAAAAYDEAAKRLFGEFAVTNQMLGLL